MIQVTIDRIFSIQICSDEPVETVTEWINANKRMQSLLKESGEWKLVPPTLCPDPNPVQCDDKPDFKHYLYYIPEFYGEVTENDSA